MILLSTQRTVNIALSPIVSKVFGSFKSAIILLQPPSKSSKFHRISHHFLILTSCFRYTITFPQLPWSSSIAVFKGNHLTFLKFHRLCFLFSLSLRAFLHVLDSTLSKILLVICEGIARIYLFECSSIRPFLFFHHNYCIDALF